MNMNIYRSDDYFRATGTSRQMAELNDNINSFFDCMCRSRESIVATDISGTPLCSEETSIWDSDRSCNNRHHNRCCCRCCCCR